MIYFHRFSNFSMKHKNLGQFSLKVISWGITYKFNGFGKRNRIHTRIHKFAKWEFEFSQLIWKKRKNYTNYFPSTALLEWIDMTSHKQDKSKKSGLKDGMRLVLDVHIIWAIIWTFKCYHLKCKTSRYW